MLVHSAAAVVAERSDLMEVIFSNHIGLNKVEVDNREMISLNQVEEDQRNLVFTYQKMEKLQLIYVSVENGVPSH